MKKLPSVLLVTIAGLLLLTTVVTAVRARRVTAANRASSAHSAPIANEPKQDGADDDAPKVIRFANNPLAMPPFLVNDLNGSVVSSADWRGNVVLVSFWATWCEPCREEIPELIELSKRYKDRLQIVGVSEDDAPAEEVRIFAKQMGMNYPVVMDGNGKISNEYGGVPALPTLFVVNQDGRVVQKHAGLFPFGVYESEIRSLLSMPIQAKVETFDDTGQIFLKNASNATILPGVDFAGLTAEQKRAALKRMNSENCTCGCKLTIAQCRITEPDCDTSPKLAAQIIRDIKSGSHATSSASTATK